MGVLTIRRVGFVIFLVWLLTLLYLWFPAIKPFQGCIWNCNKDMKRLQSKLPQNQTNLIHVILASDEHTIGGMIAAMNSVYSNTKHNVMFHLVVAQESVDHLVIWLTKTKLELAHYEVKPFPKDWITGKIKVHSGRQELSNPMNYARYYLPKLFPDLKTRVIYLDSDIIVQGDIAELYAMKMKPHHIAAFSEDCSGISKRLTLLKNNYAEYIDFKNQHIQQLHLNPKTCSFNTGLMVTQLHNWNSHNITEQLVYWMTLNTKEEVYGNEKAGGGSQPPIMIVFYKNYTHIDPNWHIRHLGMTSGTSYSKSFVEHAKLLHWSGHFKPWHRLAQHSNIWDRYYLPDPTHKFKPIRRVH
ncbi:glycosyltransferase 8 domain-containing protein 1-like [Argonauta hians]